MAPLTCESLRWLEGSGWAAKKASISSACCHIEGEGGGLEEGQCEWRRRSVGVCAWDGDGYEVTRLLEGGEPSAGVDDDGVH